jgi:signal transduction histidine kinase
MEAFIAEEQLRKARFWKVVKRASLIAPFALGAVFYVILWRINDLSFSSQMFTFSLSTCAVALILAGTYYFTYKFFKENFYFFIFVGWVANAIYLIPDLNGPRLCDLGYSNHQLYVYVLSLTSTAFQGVSLFTRAKADSPRPTWSVIPRATWTVILGLVLAYGALAYAVIPKIPGRREVVGAEKIQTLVNEKKCDPNNIFPLDDHKTLAKLMVPGAILSFLVLCAVGASLRVRLHSEDSGWKGPLLSYTFYLYAALQLPYPFIFYLWTQGDWILSLFLIAQIAKVGNALAMLGVLQSAIAYRDLRRDEQVRSAQHEVQVKEAQLAAQDATLKVQAAELQRRRQLVELGLLAASIKHDVNTPLATMAMDIGTLTNRFRNDNRIIKKLESLHDSMERIYAIVKVVDIFRGDKAFFDRDEFMRKASMLEVVHRAVRSVKNEKEELKQSNARTFIKVEGREVWVRAYPPMLEQVVVNIIKNGLEAIDEARREHGVIKIGVGITETQGGRYPRWVRVEIEDNGCGIPAEHMDKLTTIFTTRGDKKPNSGIGLFIGKKILDIHDGKIKFESEVGEGTKVTLLLPEWSALQKAEQQAAAAAPGDEPTGAQAPQNAEPGAAGVPAGAGPAAETSVPAGAGTPAKPGGIV